MQVKLVKDSGRLMRKETRKFAQSEKSHSSRETRKQVLIETSKNMGDREKGFVWMYQTEMKDRIREEMGRSRVNSLTVRPQ
jgi:hypothetical protein